MKNTTIKTITTNLNTSLQKAQESTAILRACVQLAINEDSKLTYSTLCEAIPMFSKFSAKTLKNCIRFAKSIAKSTKKLGIKALIGFYKKDETRKAYDVLVNGNRHKTQAESKQAESKQADESKQAESKQADESKQAESKQAESKQAESKQAESKQAESKQTNRVQHQADDVAEFVKSMSLEELKKAYHLIRNRLGIKTSEENIKKINAIQKIAC